MDDDKSSSTQPPESDTAQPDKGPGFFADPVVLALTYVSLGIVVLYLVTAISVVTTGITKKTGPRSVAEKDLLVASSQVKPGAVGDTWAPFVEALIASGDMGRARVALNQARASAPATIPVPDLDLAEARMYKAEGDNVRAVNLAETAMKGYEAEYKARAAATDSSDTGSAKATLADEYYSAVLVKAYSLEALGRWKDAVAMFDIYVDRHKTASDILIDRGTAKMNVNDKAGAEKDFRAALRFVPYDEEARAGLKQIGAEL